MLMALASPVTQSNEDLWPRLILVARHGKSVLNAEHRISGQVDAALNTQGQIQASRLDQVLAKTPLSAIYTSTLERTIFTALPTARRHGLPIQAIDELREQCLGVLEGRFRDERDAQAQELWRQRRANPLDFTIDGGETYQELEARVRRGVGTILTRNPGGTVLIVGHRNTNRMVLAVLLGLALDEAVRVRTSANWLHEITPGEQPVVHSRSLRPADLGECTCGLRP